MYRGGHQQADALQRDALISAYKRQLQQLQSHLEGINTIHDQMNSNQTQLSILKDQKNRIQNQYRLKHDIHRKTVSDLRAEIDSIKIQIHRCGVHIDDVSREIYGVKRACQNRQNEIANLMTINRQLDAKNQQLLEENKNKSLKIKNLKQQRNKQDTECQRLHRMLEDAINKLKSLQKQARSLEARRAQLQNIIFKAEADYKQLLQDIDSRSQAQNLHNKRLQQLTKDIGDLNQKIRRLQKQQIASAEELKRITQGLDRKILQNKDQVKILKSLQNNLRQTQNNLDAYLIQKDALQGQNQSLNSQHAMLNNEIDNILLQIIEMEQTNKQMCKQIQNYIKYDDQARNKLDRGKQMKDMLSRIYQKLGNTSAPIKHLR